MMRSSTTSVRLPESMQTRPTVTLPALRAPWSSNSRTSPLSRSMTLPTDSVMDAAISACSLSWRYSPWTGMKNFGLARLMMSLSSSWLAGPLAGGGADVDGRVGAVVVDDVGFAAEEVIDHAVDRLLVAGDDARGEHDGVVLFDFGVLVIVDSGARKGGHGLALRAADQDANFFRREVLHLAGIDHEAVGDFDVAEILSDLGRVIHGAADEGDFAAMCVREFNGQLDAMDGR